MVAWFGLDLDLVEAEPRFQNGVQSPLEWVQMDLSSLLQPVVALCASFLPFSLSGERSHECFPR